MTDIRRRFVYPAIRLMGRITGRHVSGAYCWCIEPRSHDGSSPEAQLRPEVWWHDRLVHEGVVVGRGSCTSGRSRCGPRY